MDKIYKSLADKNRRIILSILKDGEKNVNQILGGLTIGQATLSSHLAYLRKAGLVICRVAGKERWYQLNKGAFSNLLKDIEGIGGKAVQGTNDEIILRRKVV